MLQTLKHGSFFVTIKSFVVVRLNGGVVVGQVIKCLSPSLEFNIMFNNLCLLKSHYFNVSICFKWALTIYVLLQIVEKNYFIDILAGIDVEWIYVFFNIDIHLRN